MSLKEELKNEINKVINSKFKGLIITGKIENKTSLELMKIIMELEDRDSDDNLYFAYHHKFENVNYFAPILDDLKEQYENWKEIFDPGGDIANTFDLENISKIKSKGEKGFLEFLEKFALKLKSKCDHAVFLFDPETISSTNIFFDVIINILNNIPSNLKFLIYVDKINEKIYHDLEKKEGIRLFNVPSDPNQLIEYFLKITNEGNYPDNELLSYTKILGDLYYALGDFERSIDKYNQSISLANKIKNYNTTCDILIKLGFHYYFNKEFNKAIQIYEECFKIATENNLFSVAIFSEIQRARIEHQQKKYDLSLDSFNKSLELAEKINDNVNIGIIYSSMADTYIELHNNMLALDYLNKASDIFTKYPNDFENAKNFLKISKLYNTIGDNVKSDQYANLSEKIQKEKGFSLTHKNA